MDPSTTQVRIILAQWLFSMRRQGTWCSLRSLHVPPEGQLSDFRWPCKDTLRQQCLPAWSMQACLDKYRTQAETCQSRCRLGDQVWACRILMCWITLRRQDLHLRWYWQQFCPQQGSHGVEIRLTATKSFAWRTVQACKDESRTRNRTIKDVLLESILSSRVEGLT